MADYDNLVGNMPAAAPPPPPQLPPAQSGVPTAQMATGLRPPVMQPGAGIASPASMSAPAAPAQPAADLLAPVREKVSSGESGGTDPYHETYGGGHFGWQGEPDTGSGKYGFVKSTWDQTAKSWMAANPGQPAPQFDKPADQDKLFDFKASQVYKANTGGRDLAADAAAGKVDYSALAGTWPSLGKPNLRAYWTGNLSPEEKALIQKRSETVDTTIAGMSAQMQEYAKTASEAPEGTKERMEAIADMRRTSQEMQAEWRKKVMSPPVEKPIDAFANFGSAATVLGLLAGLLSRQHLTAGLNAAGVAMRAINENNHEAFEKSYQTWQTQTQLGLQMISMENQDIRQLMDDQKMSVDEKASRLQTMATELGFEKALGQMGVDKYDAGLSLLQKRDQMLVQAQNHADMMQMHYDAMKLRSAAMSGAALDKDTLAQMADQYLAGDKSVLTGLGYGNAGAANRAALRGAIETRAKELGMNGRDIATAVAEYQGLTAGERSLGTRTATMGMAVSEAKQLIPQVLKTSEAVSRTEFPSINQLILAGEKGTGDQNVVRLGIALNSFINVYARAISPTGVPTVSDKDHARDLLDSAWSKGQIGAGMDQIEKELEAAAHAPGVVRQEFRESGATQVSQPQIGTTFGASALPSGIPAGSQQVGTKDGNPVYQAPDGSRYMVH